MTWIQDWLDVLLLHFPVPADQLRPLLPRTVEIDAFGGQAWLSYVFFRLRLRPTWLPIVPGFSSLVELNVRTYVRHGGRRGIYFLRMYADNRLAIRAASLLTPLCYEPAEMIDERLADGSRHIECRPARPGAGALAVHYAVDGTPDVARAGTLDAWLLEQYRLFVRGRDGGVLTAEVEHPPWKAAKVMASSLDCGLNWHGGPSQTATACPTLRPALMHHSPGVAARFKAFAQSLLPQTLSVRPHAVGAGAD